MSYFRNIDNNGLWEAGGIYTFETWYRYYSSGGHYYGWGVICDNTGVPIMVNNGKILFPKDFSISEPLIDTETGYLSYYNKSKPNSGTVTWEQPAGFNLVTGGWVKGTITIPITCNNVKLKLCHIRYHSSDLELDEIETYEITIGNPPPPEVTVDSFLVERPEDYDPKLIWSPDDNDWVSIGDNIELFVAGGGRYRRRTAVVTLDASGNGKILVENL